LGIARRVYPYCLRLGFNCVNIRTYSVIVQRGNLVGPRWHSDYGHSGLWRNKSGCDKSETLEEPSIEETVQFMF